MEKTNFTFKGIGGKTVYATKVVATKPKAAIQIAHGMAEHKERYLGFAAFLAEAGYNVYIHDHRGHGQTAETDSENGFFAEKKGWELIVADMFEMNKIVRNENKDLPIIAMGHSMGSFATRKYVAQHPETINGVIISGTACHPGLLGKIGKLLAKTVVSFKGADYPSKFIDGLAFGSFNNSFKPARTAFDWLSRDEKEVDAYVADPKCGFLCTASFYRDVFGAILDVNSKTGFDKMPKAVPYLVFSGENDPVGNGGKGIKKVVNSMKKANIEDIELKLYPNGRHEMLNELNKEEVYKDILNWLDKKF
ncbi:MAG: lysophospholipase [Spirochaetales bacterium]|nr:lysophospholipase [Spirochaetales bacterium]